MRTEITDDPAVAGRLLREGELVVFPTETVWGIGALATSDAAVRRIFEAKARPADNPLIVHLAPEWRLGGAQLDEVIDPARRSAYLGPLIERFCPGPLTMVAHRHPALPAEVTAGLDTVGVRFVSDAAAAAMLRACGHPVAAPSANRSGRPSPTTFEAAREEMDGRVACILRGPASQIGLESTVLDCTGARPVILRRGAVTLEELREVIPDTVGVAAPDLAARSPGTRHRHYAPTIPVHLVHEPPDIVPQHAAWLGLEDPRKLLSWSLVRVFDDVEDYARQLFEAFRACERMGLEAIVCQSVDDTGLGAALMDRLRRAAEG